MEKQGPYAPPAGRSMTGLAIALALLGKACTPVPRPPAWVVDDWMNAVPLAAARAMCTPSRRGEIHSRWAEQGAHAKHW